MHINKYADIRNVKVSFIRWIVFVLPNLLLFEKIVLFKSRILINLDHQIWLAERSICVRPYRKRPLKEKMFDSRLHNTRAPVA
jgi:hypothetical protein